MISKKGGKLHFQAPIGAFVKMVTSGDASVEAEFSLFEFLVEAKLNETNRNIAYEKEKKVNKCSEERAMGAQN